MSALPPLRDVIETHGLNAKKSLGQHFLLDLNLTAKIARTADIDVGDTVLEIGPGPGGLTRALLSAGAAVTAIERDARCVAALADLDEHFPGRLNVIEADALRINESQLFGARAPVKIVANLPYNISTELLIKWLKAGPRLWSSMTLMFQKEVADRITAETGGKAYGRLSVIAQAASTPRRAFDLPARAFTPPPKVDSSVVYFLPADTGFDITALERVTAAAFGQRRKMLRSSLKTVVGDRLDAAFAEIGAAPTSRAEELSVAQFIALSKLI